MEVLIVIEYEILILRKFTIKVMILCRYRFRPVTVLCPMLPTVTVYGPTLRNATYRDINVTERY